MAAPIFTERRWFGMANFYDFMIFVSGGEDWMRREACADVFCYMVDIDEWTRAPAMNECRRQHSSCVLGTSLYVFGGFDRDRRIGSLARLVDANNKIGDTASGSWETFSIAAPKQVLPLMVSLNS